MADAGLVIVSLNDPLHPRCRRDRAADGRAGVGVAVPLSVRDRSRWAEGHRRHRSDGAASDRRQRDTDRRLRIGSTSRARTRTSPPAPRASSSSTPNVREQLREYSRFNADGQLVDSRDVIVATTNASLFGYVADGAGGLKVLQLTSPESQPKFYGFSPEPKPQLIATVSDAASPRCRCRKGSIATAASMKPAVRSPSSAASDRDRSTSMRCGGCIWTITVSHRWTRRSERAAAPRRSRSDVARADNRWPKP